MKRLYLLYAVVCLVISSGLFPRDMIAGSAEPTRANADDGSIAAADLAAVGGNNVDGGEDCIVHNLDLSVYGAMGTNSEYGYVAANDILVPAGLDMTLNGMLTTLVYEGTGSITSATVRIYADDGNKPLGGAGDAIATRTATPIAENLVSSDFADGIYEVEWAFDPIELSGALGEDVRYWVGLSTTPDDGWTNFAWAVSEYLNLGAHPYVSSGSEFYEYSSDADGSYIFFTTCVPTADAGGGDDEGGDEGEDCIVPNLDISVYGAMGTNSEYGYVAANDILVPAGLDMTLNGMLTTLVYEGTGSITSATVRIYADDGNKPLGGAGDAIATRTATPIAENLVSSDFADGIYEVEWAFDPIELSGALGEDVRYWVGLSTTPDDGWTNFAWAVSEYLNLGAHPFVSYGSEFYEYSSDADGSYIFFTTCVPTADAGGGGDEGGDEIEDCGMQVMRDPNSSGEGYNCEATNHTVANDIVVAANTDMYLTAVMPSVIMNPETSVSFATLTVYLDDNGLPGENIANETLIADSQIHQGSYGDMEAYDISFEFDPIYLPGRADQETTYWIGLSLWLQAGTAVLMEVTSEELMGHPVAISSGGNFLIPNEAHEGVISFTAECQEIDGPTDPLPGYCPVSEYEINQDAVHTCFGFVSDEGMFQSFTAEQSESSGAGFKFTEPSRGMEVTISLWDGMPESEGTVLASRTTETYGDRWVDVFWENEVTLTVGQEYFIRIEGDDELSCLRAASNIYEGGQAYAGFQPYSNYDYTFRTYYCYDVACEQILMSGGFPNSFLTSKDQPQTVATDITVPLGNDFHLNRLTVYFWVQAGSNIQHADITFYEDDFGVPGSVMETLEGVVPTSQTFVIPRYGYDVLTVVFDIPTQVLPGKFDNVTTYWVSFDVQTGLGSAMINARSDARIGHFSALTFDAGDSWEINEGWDISATFEGECLPVSGDACENPELIADQTSDLNCLALSSTGVAQSFTASTHELAGAAVKFFAPSVGYDVTLSVWDELPTQGGSKLGSKTVQTTGQAWVEVMWDFVVSVEPDQTYYLVVEGGSGLPCVAGEVEDVFEGGHAFAGVDYQAYPDWDYAFKLFGCDGGAPAGNCEEEIPEDFLFEAGVKTAINSDYMVANDLTVATGENFTLKEITASFVALGSIMHADVYYYSDNDGFPGPEIGSQLSVPVTSQTVVGERSGMNVYQATFAVEPFLFEGDPEGETTYWIGLDVCDLTCSGEVYWLVSSTQIPQGYEMMQKFQDGPWQPTIPGADAIYKWTGDCSGIPVGTNDREIAGFRFYPNPANHSLHLSSAATIWSVVFYDLLGRPVLESDVQDQSSSVDISGLPNGVYLMKVDVEGRTGTYKVVKQ